MKRLFNLLIICHSDLNITDVNLIIQVLKNKLELIEHIPRMPCTTWLSTFLLDAFLATPYMNFGGRGRDNLVWSVVGTNRRID